MEKLNVGTEWLAKKLAYALASIHMRACIDGCDIEVVLGSRPARLYLPFEELENIKDVDAIGALEEQPFRTHDFRRRYIKVCIIDCNQVKPFKKTLEDIPNLVDAFCSNEPYFLRPRRAGVSQDVELWGTFSKQYVMYCAEVGDFERELGEAFIIEVVNTLTRNVNNG